jgi:seryl-tRNA synthetase
METASISTCTDFQARRMDTKYIENKTGQRKYAYTLNGSGLALPRLMISIMENYQQKDGSIKIPKVLWKYTGFKEIKPQKPKKKEKPKPKKKIKVKKTKATKKKVKKRAKKKKR